MALEKTRRKVKLGRYVQGLRKSTDPMLKPEDIAPQLRIASTTITRMEGGLTLPGFTLLHALLGIYGATEEQRSEATRLWEHAKQGTMAVQNIAGLPTRYRAFRHDESDAVRERVMAPIAVPGLLQTSAYAEAVSVAARALLRGDDWQDRAAAERQSRQGLLNATHPLQLHAIIDEAVLRRVVGDQRVMIDQLQHLLDASTRTNITIQVVPFAAGAYGPMSGPATLLEFDDDPALAYLEHVAGGETVENATDVQAFVDAFEDVRHKVALSPEGSAKLIRAALDGLNNDEQAMAMAHQ